MTPGITNRIDELTPDAGLQHVPAKAGQAEEFHVLVRRSDMHAAIDAMFGASRSPRELPSIPLPGYQWYSRALVLEVQREAYDLGARSTAPVSEREAALLSACESAISWLEGWASAEPYISILRNAVAGARSTAAQPVEPTGRIAALEARTGMCTLEEAPSWHPGEWLCIRFNTPEERMAAWRAINGQNVDVPQCPAASGDSTPPSLEVHMDREHGGLAFGKGDPSGALRPEPEAVGQGRWISVDERMPENDDEVLVWVTGPWSKKPYAAIDSWHLHREDPTGMGGPTLEMGYMWREYEAQDITHWKRVEPPHASGERGD